MPVDSKASSKQQISIMCTDSHQYLCFLISTQGDVKCNATALWQVLACSVKLCIIQRLYLNYALVCYIKWHWISSGNWIALCTNWIQKIYFKQKAITLQQQWNDACLSIVHYHTWVKSYILTWECYSTAIDNLTNFTCNVNQPMTDSSDHTVSCRCDPCDDVKILHSLICMLWQTNEQC